MFERTRERRDACYDKVNWGGGEVGPSSSRAMWLQCSLVNISKTDFNVLASTCLLWPARSWKSRPFFLYVQRSIRSIWEEWSSVSGSRAFYWFLTLRPDSRFPLSRIQLTTFGYLKVAPRVAITGDGRMEWFFFSPPLSKCDSFRFEMLRNPVITMLPRRDRERERDLNAKFNDVNWPIEQVPPL